MSISEEIEGRTAVTLMSKPVSRRQFLLGKYLGILLAGADRHGGLGWFFDWMLLFMRWYASVDPIVFDPQVASFPFGCAGDRAPGIPAGSLVVGLRRGPGICRAWPSALAR